MSQRNNRGVRCAAHVRKPPQLAGADFGYGHWPGTLLIAGSVMESTGTRLAPSPRTGSIVAAGVAR